jgi:ElaB/YqjD/DUF883 family membrane-anchored ribosome-binding protein
MGLFNKIKSKTQCDTAKMVDRYTDAGAQFVQSVRPKETAAEIRNLLGQLDQALRDASHDEMTALRSHAGRRMADLHEVLDGAQDSLRAGYRTAVSAGEEQIRAKPWQTLGIVSGIALVLGAVIFRS